MLSPNLISKSQLLSILPFFLPSFLPIFALSSLLLIHTPLLFLPFIPSFHFLFIFFKILQISNCVFQILHCHVLSLSLSLSLSNTHTHFLKQSPFIYYHLAHQTKHESKHLRNVPSFALPSLTQSINTWLFSVGHTVLLPRENNLRLH